MEEEIQEVFLGFSTLFMYLDTSPDSRCITEGEAILNAKHLILSGITSQTEILLKVFALCLQTSSLASKPHEIDGNFIIQNGNVKIGEFKCSCKAGLSGKCKHISAVLLKFSRGNILEMERISSTDIKCYWTNQKAKSTDQYLPCPILSEVCIKDRNVANARILNSRENDECFNALVQACSSSAQNKHLYGRGRRTNDKHIIEIPGHLLSILDKVTTSFNSQLANVE